MKTTLKLIIALVLAGAGIGQAWAEGMPPRYIGHITYTKGTDDHGKLSFYHRPYDGIELSTGEALDVNAAGLGHPTDDQGHDLEGWCVYVYAYPDEGYTVKDMTLEAELTTTVMQSRRNKAADSDASFDIGQKLTLTPLPGRPYIFEMVMPDDPNLSVTVTAKFAEKAKNTEAVSYIDADGVTQTKEAGTVYVLDGTEAELAGWYVCNSTLSYEGTLKGVGDVHLILADGAEMSVDDPDDSAIDLSQKSLTIYGQSMGAEMGSLNATGVRYGIIGNDLSSVTINGGEVTATGYHGINVGNSVTINGGKVTATATGEEGYGISGGDIILGWNSATGSVTATSYGTYGSVKTADGKMLKYTDGNSQTVTLRGTLDADAIAAIAGKTLTPYGYGGYCGKASENGGKNVTWEIPLVDGATGSTLNISGTGKMADYENTNASVAGNFAPWIKPYKDGNASDGLKYPVTAVNIGGGVTSIGKKAFDSCGGLTSITIGEGVTTIGEYAFYHCDGLTTVNIPDGVTTIGNDAFKICGDLTTVTVNRYDSGITTLGSTVFYGCDKLKLILVPDEAAYDAYYGSDGKGWDDYKAKLAPQTLTVAKNASGWGTYCHRFPVSYSLSEGATAYIVAGLSEDGKSVKIEEAKVELEGNVLAAAAPATPLLLKYKGEGDVTLTAVPDKAMPVGEGDILSTGEDNCIISGNMTGSNLTHAAANDGIPALTGVEGQTSYALYNGNFLRIDTDKGIDGHRWVLTVNGDACPDVIALSTAVVTPGADGGIGRIVYTEGTGDHGTLSFYKNKGLSGRLSTGAALSTDGLEAVKDDKGNVVGYRIYVYAYPDEGYTVKDMTLQAELTTSVQQSRRFDSADTPTLQIGGAIELTPVEGKPYIFTMVMPNDPNINASVTATFAEKAMNADAVEYIDADGVTKTKDRGTVYVLDGTEAELGFEGKETWYVCNSTLDYKHLLEAEGDVHLILADGAKMSVKGEVGIAFGEKSLNIYGQSTGKDMGSLNATGDKRYGIGSNATGSVTINGGEVTATGYDGIIAENVTINGGKVTANGTGEEGSGIFSYGDITLGWNSATGSVTATSYDTYGTGSVKTADGKVLKYTDGNSQTVKLMGTLDAAAIADKTLTPYGYGGYCGKDDTETTDTDESKNVTWEIPLVDGAPGSTLTISGTGDMADYENDNASNFAPWIKPNANGNASAGLKYPVTAVNIGEGVTSIGRKAFELCYGLTSVTIGKDVNTIGESAFNGCGGLKSVTIGEGVNTIGELAFMGCFRLTSVNIPASVTEIGSIAFGGCGGLTTVTVNRYVSDEEYPITTLGDDVFTSCNKLKLILVPDEAAYDAYYGGDGWGKYKAKLAPQTMTVAKNSSGWGTYCHRFPVSYSVDGATAHKVTGLSEDGKSVSISSALSAVEPRTPLLLNYGSTGSVTLTADLTTVTTVGDGIAINSGTGFKFYGNPTADDLGDDDCDFINAEGYNSYMLYDGEFVRIDKNNGLAAHRCVLNVENGDGEWAARVLTIADGEATGMGSLTPDHAPNSEGSECIFTLDGRRVGGKPAPGIYVRNGSKVVIK